MTLLHLQRPIQTISMAVEFFFKYNHESNFFLFVLRRGRATFYNSFPFVLVQRTYIKKIRSGSIRNTKKKKKNSFR